MTTVAEQVTTTGTIPNFRPAKIQTGGGATFGGIGSADLFAVAAGVNLAAALQDASCLLDVARTPVIQAGDGIPLEGNQAWLVVHAIASAKALVDAACVALKAQEAAQ